MKDTSPNKKIFVGIIILALIGVFGYYQRRAEKLPPTPLGNKRSENDSAVHPDRETAPVEPGVKPDVNPKDGSVKIVAEFIRRNAKNPATFEFQEWSEVSKEGGYWKVRCKYKGVASFNAEVTTNAWFYIQNNQVVHTKIISKI